MIDRLPASRHLGRFPLPVSLGIIVSLRCFVLQRTVMKCNAVTRVIVSLIITPSPPIDEQLF